jgi:hypothetical protein
VFLMALFLSAFLNWFLYWALFRDQRVSDIKKGLLAIFSLMIVFGSIFFYQNQSSLSSGLYYVNLFPENSESKNYRLRGKIDCVEGDCYLLKVIFPNGGYITFEDSFGVAPLKIGEKVYMVDDKGGEWYTEATNEKVE